MAPRNILFTISYDGSDYHGWASQPNAVTVQQTISDTLSALTSQDIIIQGASRTDAGVSAIGQRGLIKINNCPIPTENFQKALNDRLPKDIAITETQLVPDNFDVITDVKSKLYKYTICTGPVRPVLEIKHLWHYPAKLDTKKIAQAATLLVGKHDFKSFASAADQRQSSTRTIFRCDVAEDADRIYIEIEGDGFLYNMVRNITGTLTEIGIGRTKPEKIADILKAKDRTAAGPIAPPQGLALIWIKY